MCASQLSSITQCSVVNCVCRPALIVAAVHAHYFMDNTWMVLASGRPPVRWTALVLMTADATAIVSEQARHHGARCACVHVLRAHHTVRRDNIGSNRIAACVQLVLLNGCRCGAARHVVVGCVVQYVAWCCKCGFDANGNSSAGHCVLLASGASVYFSRHVYLGMTFMMFGYS